MENFSSTIQESNHGSSSESTEESEPIVLNWKDADGKRVSEKTVFDWVSKTKADEDNEYRIIVGTDSQMSGLNFRFITVICVYKVGKGGNYYFLETFEKRENYILGHRGKKAKGNQKLRMFNEVEKSIVVADRLFEKTQVVPVVHIDASPSHKKEFTSAFSDQLKGYVLAAGFECAIKPNSWVSSSIANYHSR